MCKKSVVISVVILCLFIINHAYATTWYVHPDSALNTIQAGLDSSSTNDTVLVGPGTYYENIVWSTTPGIDLISEFGADTTTIDGSNSACVIVFYLPADIDTTTIIQGFKIQNGNSSNAGGICCDSSNSPMIVDNIITSNNSSYWGGGILCRYASPHIIGNTIINNSSSYVGAGLSCIQSSAIIKYNNISFNNSVFPGGGIWCDFYSSLTLVGDSICDNTSNWFGDGVCFVMSSATLDSCNISRNNGQGIYSAHYSTITIHNSNITENTIYGIQNEDTTSTVDAEYNWWGDVSGPYHPGSNPGGFGDPVSDYVNFIPWLTEPMRIVEEKTTIIHSSSYSTTIFCGYLDLPEGKKCKVFDITGRVVAPDKIKPGIYFIEIDGEIAQKVVKVR